MRATQRDHEHIGATGCYFLSIIYIAEELTAAYIDAYQAYLQALQSCAIMEDCFVSDPAALMRMLTRVNWSVSKEAAGYKPANGEKVIIRYERNDTLKNTGHFVVGNDEGGIEYDPYGTSATVRLGKPVSTRVFRRA